MKFIEQKGKVIETFENLDKLLNSIRNAQEKNEITAFDFDLIKTKIREFYNQIDDLQNLKFFEEINKIEEVIEEKTKEIDTITTKIETIEEKQIEVENRIEDLEKPVEFEIELNTDKQEELLEEVIKENEIEITEEIPDFNEEKNYFTESVEELPEEEKFKPSEDIKVNINVDDGEITKQINTSPSPDDTKEESLKSDEGDTYESKKILNETITINKTINDVISKETPLNTVETKLNTMAIADIRKSIGINDRFIFITDLFSGKKDAYEEFINEISKVGSLEEGINLMNSYYEKMNWAKKVNTFKKLQNIVDRFLKSKAE